MARLVEGMGSIDSPTFSQEDSVESGLSTLSCLHNPLCCCCEASSWAPGLESSQNLTSIKGLRILHGSADGASLGASGDGGGPGIEPSWR
eukprot:1149226-Pelagomonas_calceolata.AAC.1